MKDSLIKFIYDNQKSKVDTNKHWEYCCSNKIPHIRILNTGTKYWKIDYDILPLTMFERFVVLSYTDYTLPFYLQYCKEVNLPSNKQEYSGSGGNLMFKVYKNDAPKIAEKLFDLLIELSKKDKVLFDKNPIILNEDGFNSEGFHVAGYIEELKEMSDEQLIYEYGNTKKEKPFWLKAIQLIKNEINKRNLVVD